MSRSYRKTPFFSHCSAHSQKEYRSDENRAKRRAIHRLLHECLDSSIYDEEKFERYLPDEKTYGNEWSSPRDGKSYWEKPDPEITDFRKYGLHTMVYFWYEVWLKSMRK